MHKGQSQRSKAKVTEEWFNQPFVPKDEVYIISIYYVFHMIKRLLNFSFSRNYCNSPTNKKHE